MADPSTRYGPDDIRFTYFMVRVRVHRGAEPDGPSGTVERLGSGSKQEFHGADDLVRLVTAWSTAAADV